MLDLDFVVVQCFDHFQGSQDSINTVVFSASGLAIQMTASQDGEQTTIKASPAGEDIADPINPDPTACFPTPLHKQVAPGFVLIAQRNPTDSALWGRPDLCHGHQSLEQSFAVDLQSFSHNCSLINGRVEQCMPPPLLCSRSYGTMTTSTPAASKRRAV